MLTDAGGLGYKIIVSGGKNTCEGVVQLLVESNDKQASVLTACSREFGKEEVHVLCSQLGCAQGQRVHQSRLVESSSTTLLLNTNYCDYGMHIMTMDKECTHNLHVQASTMLL